MILMNTAIADAYAAAWEFVPKDKQHPNDWSGYKSNPNIPYSRASFYTDDTMRSIINARVILKGEHNNPLCYVREIKRMFRFDKRGGWSKHFRSFMEGQMSKPDHDWLRDIRPRSTNGALMGAPVMATLCDKRRAYEAGFTQAIVTHDSKAASYAAVLSMLGADMLNGDVRPSGIIRWMREHDEGCAKSVMRLGDVGEVTMGAEETFAAIIDILITKRTLREIIGEAVQRGGDTDSVAAAAVGIASLSPENYLSDLPYWSYYEIEGGDFHSAAELRMTDKLLAA